MPHATQCYANHRRLFPLYHLVAAPILLTNVIVVLVQLAEHPSFHEAWYLLFSVGVAVGLIASRTSIITVQDRLIGLEMRLRLAAVLPPELSGRIPELRLRHLVGLRFAGDAELPALVARCLAGELVTADQVKREVREWRGDFVRA